MTLYPSMSMTSLTMTMFAMLMMSSTMCSKKTQKSMRSMTKGELSLTTLKMLFLMSLTSLTIYYFKPAKTKSSMVPWTKSTKMTSHLSLLLDMKFLFFSTMALFVTWSMVEFSIYYMDSDTFSPKFFRLLLMFLLKMLVLTASNSLFLFFMGWEGVGFLSFLLMGWWFTRQDAKASALQAMVYKRMGDMGMILLMSTGLYLKKSWNMNSFLPPSVSASQTNIMLLACLLAAVGKSAQFGLHPWLPAAMEGPTPVSALLHSSTMVVAGVFLLMRMTSIAEPTKLFLKTCIMVGSLTAMFAATSASFQHDMKKMIAYSTTSQLGLMVVAMGFNQPLMALFHICTHAFFKAMLFLCSGSLIHSYKKEQDLRKMSKTMTTAPMSSACLLLGSIALMGMPFLSGFYSKDLILESVALSPSKMMSYSLAMMATLLTANYSFRIISFCFLKKPKNSALNPMKEENPHLYLPLIRLGAGSILAGWILSSYCLELPQITLPEVMKTLPLSVTLMGAVLSSSLVIHSKKWKTGTKNFFTKTWFFDRITHHWTLKELKSMALLGSSRALDRGWSEKSGGQGMFAVVKEASKSTQTTQTGYMKQYLLSMVTMMALTLLISSMT